MPFVNRTHRLGRGLVGWWPFNEGSGNKVSDLSGNGKDGTFGAGAASPSWVAGKYGSALSFDDSLDHISIPSSPLWNFSTSFTLFAMIKTRANPAGWDGIITKDGASPWGWAFRFNNGDLQIICGSNILAYTWTPTIGRWYSIAAVWDGNNRRIYVDGVEKASDVYSTAPPNLLEPVYIGMDYIPGEGRVFPGQIDIPMIYNRGLNASEIAELSQEPFGMTKQLNPLLYAGVVAAPPPPSGQVIIIIMSAIPFLVFPAFIFLKKRKSL